MQNATQRWQRGINGACLGAVIFGITMFWQSVGPHHWAIDAGFLAGLAAMLLWLRYARSHLWRQAGVTLLMAAYVMIAPIIAIGAWQDLIFVSGLFLPVTLCAAALYFGARFRPRTDRHDVPENIIRRDGRVV